MTLTTRLAARGTIAPRCSRPAAGGRSHTRRRLVARHTITKPRSRSTRNWRPCAHNLSARPAMAGAQRAAFAGSVSHVHGRQSRRLLRAGALCGAPALRRRPLKPQGSCPVHTPAEETGPRARPRRVWLSTRRHRQRRLTHEQSQAKLVKDSPSDGPGLVAERATAAIFPCFAPAAPTTVSDRRLGTVFRRIPAARAGNQPAERGPDQRAWHPDRRLHRPRPYRSGHGTDRVRPPAAHARGGLLHQRGNPRI